MTDDEIDAAIREVTAIVPDSLDRAIYLAGYEAGIALTPRLPWSPEETAQRLFDAYEALAGDFGYARPDSPMSWNRLSEPMRSLMIATVRAVFIARAADALDGGTQ